MKDICYLIYDKRNGIQNICISNKNLEDLKKDINRKYVFYDFKKINNSDTKVTSKELWFHIMKEQNTGPGIIELKGYSKNSWIIYFLENTHFILQNSSGEIRSSYAYRPEDIPKGIVATLLPPEFLNEYKYLEDKINLQIKSKDGKKTHLYSYYKNLEQKEKNSFIQEYQNLFNIFENKKDYNGLQILYHLYPDNKKSKKAFLRDFFPKDLMFLLVDLLEDTNDKEYVSLINHLINKDYYINQKEKDKIINSKNQQLNEIKSFLQNKEKPKTNSINAQKNKTEKIEINTINNQNFDRYKREFSKPSFENNYKETNKENEIFKEKSYVFVDLREKKKNTFYRNYPYNYQTKYNVSNVKKEWQLNSLITGIYAIKNTKINTIYIGESINIHERWIQHYLDLHNSKHHNYKLQRDFDNNGIEILSPIILEEIEVFENSSYIGIKSKLLEREKFFINYFKNLGFTVYNIENNYDNNKIFETQYSKSKEEKPVNEIHTNNSIKINSYNEVQKAKPKEEDIILSKLDVKKSFNIRLESILSDYRLGKTKQKLYHDYFSYKEQYVFSYNEFSELLNKYISGYEEDNILQNYSKPKASNENVLLKGLIFLLIFFMFIFLIGENKNPHQNISYNEIEVQPNNTLINKENVNKNNPKSGNTIKTELSKVLINNEEYFNFTNYYLSKKIIISNGFAVRFLKNLNSIPNIISITNENCVKFKNVDSQTIIYIDSTIKNVYADEELGLKFIANYLCNNI